VNSGLRNRLAAAQDWAVIVQEQRSRADKAEAALDIASDRILAKQRRADCAENEVGRLRAAQTPTAASAAWHELNCARGFLIDKNIAGTLSAEERKLLNMAQAYTDCYLEQFQRANTAEAEVERLRKANLSLRRRLHRVEAHNQWFERCESAWCHPSADNDPAALEPKP
jgi:hypothetical protein